MMVNRMEEEAPEFLDVCLHLNSPELVTRLTALLGRERPEFEDEVEQEDLAWFELLNDWPYPTKLEVRGSGVCVFWEYSWLSIGDVVKLNQLDGVSLVAVFLVEKGVEHADGNESGEENPDYGFYYRYFDGELLRMKQTVRMLSTGVELKYDEQSQQFEDLWALRESYLKVR